MEAKEALKSIRVLLGLEDKATPTAKAEQTLADGTTVIRYDEKLEEGVEVFVVTAEGEVAIPDGLHELADGSTFTAESGKVKSVEPKEEETPKKVEKTEMSSQAIEEILALKDGFAAGTPEERIANLEIVCKALMEYCYGWQMREKENEAAKQQAIDIATQFASLEAVVKAATKENETISTKHKEAFALVVGIVESFSGLPNGEPAQRPDFSFGQTQDSKAKSLADTIESFKKLKTK